MPSKLEKSLSLPISGAGALVADLGSQLAVIATHPWGPLGGNMHNNVVAAAVLYFQNLGITTLRFDFAGSQIGKGNYQVSQVEEAAKFVLSGQHMEPPASSSKNSSRHAPPCFILLVGYSYGALIAGSATANIPQCVGFVSIAPPVAVKHWLLFFNSNFHMDQARKRTKLPRLMVIGTRDNFTSEDSFMEMVASFPTETTTGALLKGADHFFARREKDLMAIIGQWLLDSYPACGKDLRLIGHLDLEMFTKNACKGATEEEVAGPTVTKPGFGCAVLEATTCQD